MTIGSMFFEFDKLRKRYYISNHIVTNLAFFFQGTLKKYVDDFFTIILTANESIPPVIKSLFDFLDEAATKYEVEPEVVYNWKCNR